MTVYESIGEMMQAQAEDAVREGRHLYGFKLDYSEASIVQLETILSAATLKLREDEQNQQAQLEIQTKLWGGYFGEVIRRRWGGDWTLERYPAGNSAVPTLTVRGSKLFPLMKVYRRLTLGEPEGLPSFYKMVLTKIGAAPLEESEL